MPNKGKVLLGMSGGVDSSVAAILLMEAGYEVVGATFRLWDPGADSLFEESSCCAVDDVNDARRVCHDLGIPHYVLNYKELFREKVVAYFAAEYLRGATPNPCIACNHHIKFDAFLQKALSMGFDYIATGHYATVLYDEERQSYRLQKGEYLPKDQSYVLYTLTQETLSHLLLPLGKFEKAQIRKIAAQHGLRISQKADSQDICFVPDGNYAAFLETYLGKRAAEGNFLDRDGNVLGRHRGIWHYTIGQRKGLGISLGKPMFVYSIDSENNTVTLAENQDLMVSSLIASDLTFTEIQTFDAPLQVDVKIRYASAATPATIFPLPDNMVKVVFESLQRAVTPGQAVVFYDGDFLFGGAVIQKKL